MQYADSRHPGTYQWRQAFDGLLKAMAGLCALNPLLQLRNAAHGYGEKGERCALQPNWRLLYANITERIAQ